MEYKSYISEVNNDRIVELISELTEIKKETILSALNKYSVEEIFKSPGLVEDEKAERLLDLKNVIPFIDLEGTNNE